MTNFDVLVCICTFFFNEDQFSLRKKKFRPLQLWSEMCYAVLYFKHNGVINETSFVPLSKTSTLDLMDIMIQN